MKTFKEQILIKLLEKYNNSKLSKGMCKKNITIKLVVGKDNILNNFIDPKGVKFISSNIADLKCLEDEGFIHLEYDYSKLTKVYLNIEKVDAIYKIVKMINPKDYIKELETYIYTKNYDNFLNNFISHIKKELLIKKTCSDYFSNINDLKELLYIIENMINLNEETMERDFSVNYLNDSKRFASKRNIVIKIIRNFDYFIDENLTDEEVLANYNIVKNSTYALVKNGLRIKLGNQVIDLNLMNCELCLSDIMIRNLDILSSTFNKVITVENLTSFYMLNEDAVIIYLGGFHNHTKQMLLKKINSCIKMDYYHFGDIDAGGFYIFNNLRNKTKLPFKPYKMGIEELEINKDHLKKLTMNDRKRLESMLKTNDFSIFHPTIKYMLSYDVKLEQEILD